MASSTTNKKTTASSSANRQPPPPPLPDRYPQDEVNRMVRTQYVALPVAYPPDFLAPLPDPMRVMEYKKLDFEAEGVPQYKDCYAAVLDNVLSRDECRQLLHYIEMSAGLHRSAEEMEEALGTGAGTGTCTEVSDVSRPGGGGEGETTNMAVGWQPARVSAGESMEVFAPHYRRSMRIIWDEKEVARRIWNRMNQIPQVREYLNGDLMDDKNYPRVRGYEKAKSITLTDQGLNERMRCLKYDGGDFFLYHTDSPYIDDANNVRTFYTIQLYLNDSIQALGMEQLPAQASSEGSDSDLPMVNGGSTSFRAGRRGEHIIDVWPKAGRVLVFQHERLGHIGGSVDGGTKYTIRSDIEYKLA